MALARAARDPRRTLLLKLRRTVRVSRRFDVAADPSDPCVELQTCRECGHVERYRHETTPAMAQKQIRYRADGGVTGICPACSRREAARRYPLPEDRR